jgi:hypothetical protein
LPMKLMAVMPEGARVTDRDGVEKIIMLPMGSAPAKAEANP